MLKQNIIEEKSIEVNIMKEKVTEPFINNYMPLQNCAILRQKSIDIAN